MIELAWLSEEQQNALNTDMNIFVDALRQIRLTGEYKPSDTRYVKHVEDILTLLRALSGYRDEYTEALFRYGAKREKGESATMVDIIGAAQKYYARVGREEGRAEGLAEGLAQGEAKGQAKGLRRGFEFMKSLGVSPENLEKFKAMYPDLQLDSETQCPEQD